MRPLLKSGGTTAALQMGPTIAPPHPWEVIMRNEMMGAVVRRAIEHPEFRRRLIDNPQEALAAHGFALEDSDLAEIEKIRTRLGEGDDGEQQLVSMAAHYGMEPRT